eukprot:2677336-Rhodomonas_salina.1
MHVSLDHSGAMQFSVPETGALSRQVSKVSIGCMLTEQRSIQQWMFGARISGHRIVVFFVENVSTRGGTQSKWSAAFLGTYELECSGTRVR